MKSLGKFPVNVAVLSKEIEEVALVRQKQDATFKKSKWIVRGQNKQTLKCD